MAEGEGKAAVVTGAGTGIGRNLAPTLLAHGYKVAFMAAIPLNANVQFMTVMATATPFMGRG